MKDKINIIRKWLIWVTNNQDRPKHEIEFDIAFFLINTIALGIGIFALIKTEQYPWIPFLVIEYTWALDNMRHNREY